MASPQLDGDLTLLDEFAGAGGSTQGAASVPGVTPIFASNHWSVALESHAANFPTVEHHCGDISKVDMTKFPRADIAWSSPACPAFSNARGVKRDFDQTNQYTLFDDGSVDNNAVRSRALMEEVPRYLQSVANRGRPVLVGVVENVVQCKEWGEFDRWLREIQMMGYKTRVISYNSMHAEPEYTARAPQSRDRLYVAYWHESLGRDPDWDKWLRPRAYCDSCDEVVDATQVFKKQGKDIAGKYRQQYVYKHASQRCNWRTVEPGVMPAAVAIDWSIEGQRIGDRTKPLKQATLDRIEAGLKKYAMPITLAAAGHTFERRPGVRSWPVTDPLKTQSTTEQYGVAVPPMLIPVEARADGRERHVGQPFRTQTARAETGLAWWPFIAPLSGGGDKERARSIDDPLATFRASGLHHGLAYPENFPAMLMRNNSGGAEMSTPVTEEMRTLTTSGHQSLITWEHLMVPYYNNGKAQPIGDPMGTLTTHDRYGLASAQLPEIKVDDVRFRMLEPHEIQIGMAFARDYQVLGSKRDQVRQLGNGVTPPVAELIVSALVETITGEQLERSYGQSRLPQGRSIADGFGGLQ